MKCLQGCRMKMLRWFMGLLARSCVCMLTCLLSLVIDGIVYFLVFSCPLLLHLIFGSVVELHLQLVSGNVGAQKSGIICSCAAEEGCLQCIPSCEKFQLPFIQQPALPALSLANSAMQLRVINAKDFGIKKPKSVGTAQTKLNCKIKEHRQFS